MPSGYQFRSTKNKEKVPLLVTLELNHGLPATGARHLGQRARPLLTEKYWP